MDEMGEWVDDEQAPSGEVSHWLDHVTADEYDTLTKAQQQEADRRLIARMERTLKESVESMAASAALDARIAASEAEREARRDAREIEEAGREEKLRQEKLTKVGADLVAARRDASARLADGTLNARQYEIRLKEIAAQTEHEVLVAQAGEELANKMERLKTIEDPQEHAAARAEILGEIDKIADRENAAIAKRDADEWAQVEKWKEDERLRKLPSGSYVDSRGRVVKRIYDTDGTVVEQVGRHVR